MRYLVAFFLMCAAARGQVIFTNQIPYTSSNQEYITTGINGVFTNVTLTAWINSFEPRFDGNFSAIIGSSKGNAPYAYLQMQIQSNYASAWIADLTPAGYYSGETVWIVTHEYEISSELTLVAFVRDWSNTTIYVNDTSTTRAGYPSRTITAAHPLFVGARNGGIPYNGINAALSDVRFYTRALSASEIYEIYHNPWMHADDPALVLRTAQVTDDTGTALSGVARNIGTGPDGTYSNSPTAAQPHVQSEKPLTMELP